jgi:drug/metabolite transporter (DMT)-like permease
MLVTFLIPVSALVLGIGILGERLAPGHLAGMALIALGLAAIDGRPFAWLARPRQPARPAQLRP